MDRLTTSLLLQQYKHVFKTPRGVVIRSSLVRSPHPILFSSKSLATFIPVHARNATFTKEAVIRARNQALSTWSRRSNRSPYEILGVSNSATDKEIKLGYFREAKKYHPDLNPDDPLAKAKFQEISAAYELLSDPTRRRLYDTTGFTGDTSHQSRGSQQAQQQHAEEMFYTVQQDVEVVKEAVGLYFEEMKDEMNYAIDCALRRDWKGLGEVANAHKGIVIGVVVPTILFLRYPPAVFAVMRVLFAAGQLAVAGLVYTGNVEIAVRTLWKAIVKLSIEQKRRSEEKRKT